jgi:hypothetical protein
MNRDTNSASNIRPSHLDYLVGVSAARRVYDVGGVCAIYDNLSYLKIAGKVCVIAIKGKGDVIPYAGCVGEQGRGICIE